MALRVQASCLATLVFIADRPPQALSFTRGPTGKVRPRPIFSHDHVSPTAAVASPSSEPERIQTSWASPRAMPPPPPRRLSSPEIDESSLELALLNLEVAQASRTPVAGTGIRSHDDVSSSPTATSGAGDDDDVDVLASVQRHLASGSVSGAISFLAMAASGRVSARSAAETSAISDGFRAALQSCANRGLWREARQVLVTYMPAAEVFTTEADWLQALAACAGAGGSDQAVFYLHDMRMRGIELSKFAYGAAILACARNGDTGRSLFLFKEAAKRGVPLPPADTADIMRAVSKKGTGWKQALAIYEGFLEFGLAQAKNASEDKQQGIFVGDMRSSCDDTKGDDVRGPLLGQGQLLHLLPDIAPGWEAVCQAALEACTSGVKWERALEILSILRAGGGGAELSKAAYDEAIEVCGKGRAWDMVLLLVAEMSSDEIPMSPATFETALKGCAATGAWSWALSLLRCMSVTTDVANGVPLNPSHYLNALHSCAKVVDKPGGPQAKSAAKAALGLLQDVRETGWLIGQHGEKSYMYAMRSCAVAQDAWSALALLDSAQDDRVQRSVALWTGAMQACSGAGEWRAALSILDDMQAEGLRPDGGAYVAAMEACARGGMMDLALELLDRVLQEHPGDETTITAGYHGAIKACANGGQWEEATSLLQRMRQDPVAVVTSKEYNAAILACCRAQQPVAALTLLGDMSVETNGCKVDETSYILVMRAFGREGRWRTVIDLMRSLQEEGGLVPTVSSYNVVVEALAKAGEWVTALEILAEMKENGFRPTEFTYSRCMAACEKSDEWEQTLALLADLRQQEDIVPDSYIFSTAMMACSKAGRLDDVLGILQEMRDMSANSGPNLVNYNIAIGSCARARDWTRMLAEMDKMRREDIEPEESTFSVPLDVCGRTGNLTMALDLLDRMRECGVEPGVVTYGPAVAAACRAGKTASAALLLDEMTAAGHPPNERTYGVAALACREGTNAEAAVDLLRRMKKQGLPPDALVLSCAVQACSNAGDMAFGLELITEMKRAGFVPDIGFYNSVIAGINASYGTVLRRVEQADVDGQGLGKH